VKKIFEKAEITSVPKWSAAPPRQISEITIEYVKQKKAFGDLIGGYEASTITARKSLSKWTGVFMIIYNAAWRLDNLLFLRYNDLNNFSQEPAIE
jgi:hypothetical protein